MENEYKKKIIELAKELEKIRLEIYQKANKEQDKEFFNYVNDTLFKIQSQLSYEVADSVDLLLIE